MTVSVLLIIAGDKHVVLGLRNFWESTKVFIVCVCAFATVAYGVSSPALFTRSVDALK